MASPTRYTQLIEHIFHERWKHGAEEVFFERADIDSAARHLNIEPPKNLGDLVYSFRYRVALPDSVRRTASNGREWIIRPAGRAKYRFVLVSEALIVPRALMAETKVPDATPGIVARWRLSDEQALLAKLRYNRLIDLFTGVNCYSLQNHLRTTVPGLGQVETDEIYVGIDRRGAQFVLPVQAKGGSDRLSIVQIEQDFALCKAKFPTLIAWPIAAQFVGDDRIALFDFEATEEGVRLSSEKHYSLVPKDDVSEEDLARYGQEA